MNKFEYLQQLKEAFELYAAKNKLQESSTINIDWAELKFILSFIAKEEQPQESLVNSSEVNYRFGSECLYEAKLAAYWWFVKEKGLEEDFEYFWNDKLLDSSR